MRVDNEEIPVELVRDNMKESTSNIHLIRLLSPEFCKHFVEARWAEQERWVQAVTHYELEAEGAGKGVDKDLWDALVMPETVENACRFVEVRRRIEEGLAEWLDPTKDNYLKLGVLVLARYGQGGHLRVHADAMPHINRFRRWSLVLFLNDDFEGGTTSFPLLGTEYRGSAGQALLFPSHYVHRGERVVSGHKFVLVFFLGDPATAPPGF